MAFPFLPARKHIDASDVLICKEKSEKQESEEVWGTMDGVLGSGSGAHPFFLSCLFCALLRL